MSIRISAIREVEDPRLIVAATQPHRRGFPDPLDPRCESPLGRMRLRRQISEAEYEAGCRWRNIYLGWLTSIGAPDPFPDAIDCGGSSSGAQGPLSSNPSELDDERDAALAHVTRDGIKVLKSKGIRVFHAVNAVAVYEEPEELGDFQFTAKAAKIGLGALVVFFGI